MAGTTSRGVGPLDIDSPNAEMHKNNTQRKPSAFSNYVRKMLRQELEPCLSPIPTLGFSAIFFLVVAVIAISLAALIYWQTLMNSEATVRYDNFILNETLLNSDRSRGEFLWRADPPFQSSYNLRIIEKMESPVYVYYELTDFYQSHKRYIRSTSEQQMGGDTPSTRSLSPCDPYRFAKGDPTSEDSGTKNVIVPCGLVAHSLFNDSFSLDDSVDGHDNPLGLSMKETGIATEWDRKYLYGDVEPQFFNNVPEDRGGGVIEGKLNEDEHFMVWMRVGATPTIRKLYGIIEDDIPEGSVLTFNITHQYNTYEFGGKKKLILSTTNWTGGRNEVTGIVYFVIGSLSAVACILILVLDLNSNRRPGDLQALSWNRD